MAFFCDYGSEPLGSLNVERSLGQLGYYHIVNSDPQGMPEESARLCVGVSSFAAFALISAHVIRSSVTLCVPDTSNDIG